MTAIVVLRAVLQAGVVSPNPKCRSRQQMNFAHQRANESFNVSPEVRLERWAVDYLDAVLLTSPPQGSAAKFFGVVQMQRSRNSTGQPFGIDLQAGEVSRFRQHRSANCQCHGCCRRRPKRKKKSQNIACGHINCQRKPRTPDRLTVQVIHHNYIH